MKKRHIQPDIMRKFAKIYVPFCPTIPNHSISVSYEIEAPTGLIKKDVCRMTAPVSKAMFQIIPAVLQHVVGSFSIFHHRVIIFRPLRCAAFSAALNTGLIASGSIPGAQEACLPLRSDNPQASLIFSFPCLLVYYVSVKFRIAGLYGRLIEKLVHFS